MKKIAILCFILLLVTACEQKEQDNKEFNIMATSVDCSTMKEMLINGAYLIDVRSKEEYDVSTLDFAINVPLNEIKDKIDDILPNKETPVIVFCMSGSRSKMATEYLIDMGYLHVYDLGSINNCNI